ncbi:cytochrome c biogenesis heme-transporting ATPase CcmA [Parasulfuritortus cantonensis]|uniref:Cytochrome c biogenesis heme-transporting ATPase CcmA n=1 Tax=Parasulfuritortus cantonensis TaxID=2528202 RepID=A0A4R1BIL2_9PROT|nr:cytochrome c biogenesis heme-transporting ATPase CcmA [Parasulfuritortus cantonensis]TCJ17126.1 cytochrome c biogenesis heme-transporting ATPase CcmA [Parasulfuritortus cantonensis]
MSDTAAVLSVHDLACARGERTLFTGMNFSLGQGQLLLVQGGNGRGKTSLLRLLTGLAHPLAGEIRWRGRALADGRELFHREMAYLGHLNGIKDELTPVENLRLAGDLEGMPMDQATAERALTDIGLARCLDLPCRVLSFGQRRRVALAGLVASGSLLWILDEPLTGLDVHGVAMVEGLLRDHVGAGGMVVMTTHQPLALDGLAVVPLLVGPALTRPEPGNQEEPACCAS